MLGRTPSRVITSIASRPRRPQRHSIRGIRTQPAHEHPTEHNDDQPVKTIPSFGSATPRQLVEYLNQFVIGQENAKKVLSVAIFNHYNRVRANRSLFQPRGTRMADQFDDVVYPTNVRPIRKPIANASSYMSQTPFPLFEKSNVLVIGPTGSGKTLLARTLANVLDVPFSVSDATSFTQAGYVGEDVDMAVQRLLQDANYDPVRASMGIVYIDEIDKIARRNGSGMEGSRDVSGEGVQQALLRMMEGSVVTVQIKGGEAHPPLETQSRNGQGAPSPSVAPAKNDIYHIDTSNVLFILSGAFVNLDKIVRQRVSKASIGFSASEDDGPVLPFFTPNRKANTSVLELVETSDLIQYGFIPEFVSRLPSITTLSPLTIPDLRRILTEVKGSLMSQYQALFGYSGVDIRFTSAAIDEICRKAADKGGGARGLRGIMESLLLDPMYEVPGSDIRHVLITEDVVKGKTDALYWQRSEGAAVAFLKAWAAEEAVHGRRAKESS
ncbi:P-loop containing nucleoside triphosphate hydrolase protein [Armillaria luteobubalina]|uniref:P-loop containing nucleoside triphosphate hydrolase protein n=1 Tax=Armillaria luteobubalina TaxID=153913 RepID=A0AA39QCL2_9AGAR|nr:P-loop containing nucleoside triphosphate hydrolase protein [Armillaria luteobubalina]